MGNEVNGTGGQATPSIEDLQAQINQLMAERVKLKSAFDKTASEAADYKRQLHDRMSADEQAEASRREAEEKQKETLSNLSRELSVMKATARYLKQGLDENSAKECAEFEANGDMDALMSKIFQHNKTSTENALKDAQAKWLENRPPVNAGHGEDAGKKEEEDPFLKGFNNPTML